LPSETFSVPSLLFIICSPDGLSCCVVFLTNISYTTMKHHHHHLHRHDHHNHLLYHHHHHQR
jgi:hypothetical protein